MWQKTKLVHEKNTKEKGFAAEKKAQDFLRKNGYKIIDQNVRYKFGELDIVAIHENNLVFIEVRHRASEKFGYPFETVNLRKQKRIIKAAEAYLIKESKKIPFCRFDVVSILGTFPNEEITVIKNAFYKNYG